MYCVSLYQITNIKKDIPVLHVYFLSVESNTREPISISVHVPINGTSDANKLQVNTNVVSIQSGSP